MFTPDEIIEMAEPCGLLVTQQLEAFAKLVADKAAKSERERIANKVDELGDGDPVYTWWVAEQIRAEGDKQ